MCIPGECKVLTDLKACTLQEAASGSGERSEDVLYAHHTWMLLPTGVGEKVARDLYVLMLLARNNTKTNIQDWVDRTWGAYWMVLKTSFFSLTQPSEPTFKPSAWPVSRHGRHVATFLPPPPPSLPFALSESCI